MSRSQGIVYEPTLYTVIPVGSVLSISHEINLSHSRSWLLAQSYKKVTKWLRFICTNVINMFFGYKNCNNVSHNTGTMTEHKAIGDKIELSLFEHWTTSFTCFITFVFSMGHPINTLLNMLHLHMPVFFLIIFYTHILFLSVELFVQ